MLRHYSLSSYFQQRFGCKVRKVPLDVGATCPNRDGTLSRRGCSFCNEHGSGSGLFGRGVDLEGQWRSWTSGQCETTGLSLAYLQSFSNTHCSVERLRDVLCQITALPGLVGVAIGTRPDCLGEDQMDLLAGLDVAEMWLDLGLQSSNNATLLRINRGHSAEDFARTVEQAAERGLKVCAHLIAGLPGEGEDEFAASVDFVNALPVAGVKLHNLYICKGTPLDDEFQRGGYEPLTLEDYASLLARVLLRLRPDMVVHRLASDPAHGELAAPEWAANKLRVLNRLARIMARADTWQGKAAGARAGRPPWFDADGPLPSALA